MGIEIELSGLKVSGNAEIMDNAKIRKSKDVDITVRDTDIGENAKVLNNLEIDPLLDELMRESQKMDKRSPEYLSIQKILNVKGWNRDDLVGCVLKHIGEFSQGVLASIVAARFF